METKFFLPKDYYEEANLEDKVTNIELVYDDMIFDYHDPESGMIYKTIPLQFEYHLFKEDVDFLLKEYFKNKGVTINGSILPALTDELVDEDRLYLNVEYLIDKPEYKNMMLEHCKARAVKEFNNAFLYWGGPREIENYLEKDTLV